MSSCGSGHTLGSDKLKDVAGIGSGMCQETLSPATAETLGGLRGGVENTKSISIRSGSLLKLQLHQNHREACYNADSRAPPPEFQINFV